MTADPSKGRRPGRGSRATASSRGLSLSTRMRDGLRRGADRVLDRDLVWSGLFVLTVMALLLARPPGSRRAEGLKEGDRAPGEIVTRREIDVVDEPRTEAERDAARLAVPDVYLHDADRGAGLVETMTSLLETGRRVMNETKEADPTAVAVRVRAEWRSPPGGREVDTLVRLGFAPELQRDLAGVLRQVMQGLVVGNLAVLSREPAVVLIHSPGNRAERISDYSAVMDLQEARSRVRREIEAGLTVSQPDREVLADWVDSFVDVNLAFDPERTAARREAAAATVPAVVRRVPPGTVLVRAGETLTAETLAKINAMRDPSSRRVSLAEFAGLLTVVFLLAFFLHRYARFHQRGFKRVRHLHALLVLAVVSMLVLTRAVLWIAQEVVDGLKGPWSDVGSYAYLVPLSGGAILVALLASGRIAMVYAGFTAILFGALIGWDAHRITWALLAQWGGVYAITAYRERAALLRAGLVAGGAGAAAALAIEAFRTGLDPLSRGLFAAGLALLGGAVGAGLLVSFALPLLERLFNVLTDVRLLELSNVNNPLISDLAVKAPGSYNHSLVVGSLAEEAAKTIGANSLFCRVAALYHDIGKIRKPEYFVENQRGTNPHDRLSPFMSALIIASHVKDGIRLAREAGLPEQVVDIIPQHHGTRVMSYFLDKARRGADPSLGPVGEADFRYPGPKPQTREAAIFMLSDAVEAAARTVDDPTPGRLQEVIHKVASAIVLDGQLDECDLTFADLERIEEAFLRSLVSAYHHRVDYPGFEFGRSRGNGRPAGEAADRRSGRGS